MSDSESSDEDFMETTKLKDSKGKRKAPARPSQPAKRHKKVTHVPTDLTPYGFTAKVHRAPARDYKTWHHAQALDKFATKKAAWEWYQDWMA